MAEARRIQGTFDQMIGGAFGEEEGGEEVAAAAAAEPERWGRGC